MMLYLAMAGLWIVAVIVPSLWHSATVSNVIMMGDCTLLLSAARNDMPLAAELAGAYDIIRESIEVPRPHIFLCTPSLELETTTHRHGAAVRIGHFDGPACQTGASCLFREQLKNLS